MTARVVSDFYKNALEHVFGVGQTNYVPYLVEYYKGGLLANPTVSNTSNHMSVATQGSVSAGGTQIHSTNFYNSQNWTLPSNGVTILSTPINIYTAGSGVFGSTGLSHTNGHLRFKRKTGNGSTETGVLDIEMSTVRNPQKAKVDKDTFVHSNNFAVLELGFKILTRGNTSFNNALANTILKSLLIKGDTTINGWIGFFGGLPFIQDAGGSFHNAPIVFSAYDGVVPLSANFEATGTKLWEHVKTDSTSLVLEEQIFDIAGNSISLKIATVLIFLLMGLLHIFV